MSLRVVFMGTPEFSVPSLEAVLMAGHNVVAVYSQPPRPAGRGMELKKSPVQTYAEQMKLQVLTPPSFKSQIDQDIFKSHKADVAVVVAYGLLLPPVILNTPKFGCYNLHPSLLPRWRGAAPIQRAILSGDNETAVVIMRMDEGLDTGPIAATERVTISSNITSGELHIFMAKKGAELLVKVLEDIEEGKSRLEPQSVNGVLYAPKIEKKVAKIDFLLPSSVVHNLIRGLSPFPGAWFEFSTSSVSSERIKVLRSELAQGRGIPGTVLDENLTIACLEGAIRLLEVQRAGKSAMRADEFLRGFPIKIGMRLN